MPKKIALASKHNFSRSLMPLIRADASRQGHQESCHNGTCASSSLSDTSACSSRLCSSRRRGGGFLEIERPVGRGWRGEVRGEGSRGSGDNGTLINGRDEANGSSILHLSCLSPFNLQLTNSRTGRKEVDGDETSDYERNCNLNPFGCRLEPRSEKFNNFFHLSKNFDKSL